MIPRSIDKIYDLLKFKKQPFIFLRKMFAQNEIQYRSFKTTLFRTLLNARNRKIPLSKDKNTLKIKKYLYKNNNFSSVAFAIAYLF
jgi:hypothetical protein